MCINRVQNQNVSTNGEKSCTDHIWTVCIFLCLWPSPLPPSPIPQLSVPLAPILFHPHHHLHHYNHIQRLHNHSHHQLFNKHQHHLQLYQHHHIHKLGFWFWVFILMCFLQTSHWAVFRHIIIYFCASGFMSVTTYEHVKHSENTWKLRNYLKLLFVSMHSGTVGAILVKSL